MLPSCNTTKKRCSTIVMMISTRMVATVVIVILCCYTKEVRGLNCNAASITKTKSCSATGTTNYLLMGRTKSSRLLSPKTAPFSSSSSSEEEEKETVVRRTNTKTGVGTVVAAAMLSLSLVVCAFSTPAQARDYGSMTEEQKAVAEAWRVVDNSFLDRSFNGKDWFQMRQTLVQKKYKNMDDARTAIDEMVSSLGDKYTRYLPPSKYQSMVDSATGTLAGVGVQLSTNSNNNNQVIALDVEPNSPASRGGIQPLDIFLEVDGFNCLSGATPDDVAAKLRGPEGSKVGIVMERDGKKLDFILTRQLIRVTSVLSYLSNKIGVIRIKSFSGTTAELVNDAWTELKKKGATAFLIDLRGNPGGLLTGGVDAASLFLEANKPIVFTVNKNGIVDAQQTLAPGIDLDDPLVLFVDGNTASAAEVFAAALKENGRATLVGQQTFGKGIVQTVRPLSNDNGGVAVTVQKYETPKHNNINKQGIPVDIVISDCTKTDVASCVPDSAFRKPLEE